MEISSDSPFVPVSLKLTVNRRGTPILTTLPVADLQQPPESGLWVLPQIGFGQGFSTGLILLSARDGLGSAGILGFRQSSGEGLDVRIQGTSTSQFSFELFPDGARTLRPGNSASPASIGLDSSDPNLSELAVNRGNEKVLRPLVIDSSGNIRPDFEVSFSCVDNEIAEVDARGLIRAKKEGFATIVGSLPLR